MTYSDKYRKRDIIHASGCGDLSKLKILFKYSNRYIEDALFYSIRSCNIDCVNFLVSIDKSYIHKLRHNFIWEINNHRSKFSDRIKMFRLLNDIGFSHIPFELATYYLKARKKKYFKETLLEFRNEIDLNRLLEDFNRPNLIHDRQDIINLIIAEIRNDKINKICN